MKLGGRLGWLVLLTGLGGLLVGAAALHEVLAAHSTKLVAVGATAVVLVIGDISLLQMRHGRNSISYTWGEAALLTGAAVGGWGWVVALIGPALLLRQVTAHRPWQKVVFNAGNAVLAAALARAAHRFVMADLHERHSGLDWRTACAGVAAASVYFLFVSVTTACAVAWSQGLPVRVVWLRGLRLRLVMFAGNTGTGVAIVAVGAHNRPALLALPFVVLVVYLAYNDYVRAQQERDSWRELHHTASRLGESDPRGVVAAVQRGARTLFGAELAGLLLTDTDSFTTLDAPALLERGRRLARPVSLQVALQPPAVAQEMRALGAATVVLAPLYNGDVVVGVLLLGYGATVHLNRRELKMLATFADQTSLSIRHTRFFVAMDTQRRRLSGIVDHASDGILLLNAAGVVQAWNPAMHRMTAQDSQQAVGSALEDVVSGHLDDGTPLSGAELLRRGDTADGAVLLASIGTPDAGHREVSMSVSVVRADDDVSVVVVARDVTAQHEAQQAKEDFLATVSHELRTPLTPIKGYLAMLQRPGLWADATRRDSILTILREQATQLERLVEDLLSVSQMTRGQFDVLVEAVDVDEVVDRAVRDCPAGATRLVRHLRSPHPAIAVCDPARLQQVVANLLSNADKYSPAGEPVEVEVVLGAQVEVTVTDYGTGVPLEAREQVFEPFRRLGNHLTRSTRGTGLGLHIARQLVQAMEGSIWVDGLPGRGAVFHVALPRAVPPAQVARPQLQAAQG